MPDTARPPTLADVARRAGVSGMTVSRVINDHPSVAPDTRRRVRDALQELGYRPNVAARSLAGGRSRTVGVITFDTSLYGPGAALLGIERAARARRYGVSIETLERLDRPSLQAAVRSMAVRQVEGAIVIAPHVSASGALGAARRTFPIVAVEAARPGEVPLVAVDQVLGAELATRHLLELGHATVWHVAGPDDWFESRQRIQGWRRALRAAGAPAPRLLRGDWTARSGYRAGLALATRHPEATAVFVANDQMALGVLHAFHEHGLAVPGRISVAGFDDVPESAYFSPALTTVRQPFDDLGRRGLELLVRILDGEPVDDGLVLDIPPELLVRASTGPPPPGIG